MLETFWNEHKISLMALVGAAVVALMSVVVVPETEQAVVIRLGEPESVINRFRPKVPFGQTGAGVSLRIPFVESLVRVDKRMLSLDMERQEVLSSDQLRLQVDAYARYRIIDPVRMVKSAGSVEALETQLAPIFNSALRQELGKRPFQMLLTAERGAAMQRIRIGLDREARQYGAQVIDVRIKRADLPEGALESAFARMAAARDQEATTIRAQGLKNAQSTRADAEAEAARIYAASFGKDPGFYDFYRSMQSYDYTFGSKDGASTIILSPDNEYLRQFRGR